MLASIGGLQLIPENQSRLVTLTTLAFTAACSPPSSGPKVSRAGLRGLVALVPGEELNDPHFGPVTQSIFFHGSDYLVLPGLTRHLVFVTSSMTRGLFLRTQPIPDPEFVQAAFVRLKALLLLSTHACKQAGLSRNIPMPDEADHHSTIIPHAERLDSLRHAVRLEDETMLALLEPAAIDPDVLRDFSIDAGTWSLDDFANPEANALIRRPLVRFGDRIVIASVGDLLPAWCGWLRESAAERDLCDALATCFGQAVWHEIMNAAILCGWGNAMPIGCAFSGPDGQIREAVFPIDNDKTVHVLSLTDPQTPSGEDPDCWRADTVLPAIQEQIRMARGHLFEQSPELNEVSHLVLVQPMARHFYFSSDPDENPVAEHTVANAAEYSIVAQIAEANPLVLRQFERALNSTAAGQIIGGASMLDKFWLYRSRDESFYISDDETPHQVLIQPDQGMSLAGEVVDQRDYHGVLSPRGGTVQVTRRYDSGRIPIYFAPAYTQPALLVEGYEVPVWVTATLIEVPPVESAILRDFLGVLADTLAYWLWQFTPLLGPAIQEYRNRRGSMLHVRVLPAPDARWEELLGLDPEEDDPGFKVCCEEDEVLIQVDHRFARWIGGEDNSNERLFVREVLLAIASLTDPEQALATPEDVDRWLDSVAPRGAKRMFQTFRVGKSASAARDTMQSPRYVQPAEESMVLDGVGEHLRREKGHTAEDTADGAKGRQLLNEAAEYLFARLETLVATLSPHGLLETLIKLHEQLVFDREHRRWMLPSRRACFGSSSPDLVEKYAGETAECSQASVVLRFLIEYCGTRLPSGLRPISLSVIDEMMAIVATIVNFGFESDLIHFGITNAMARIVPSGRLGVSRDEYQDARERYLQRWTLGEFSRTDASAQYHEPARLRARQEEISRAYDDAFVGEFGFGLSDLRTFIEMVLSHPASREAVGCVREHELVEDIVARGQLDAETTRAVLAGLIIEPRADFLTPPQGYKPVDTFPWRFNRPLSFARRPFVRRSREHVVELLWGSTHLEHLLGYFHNLVLTERIKAKTPEMRRVVGMAVKLAGDRLEHETAEAVRSLEGKIVRQAVKKLGPLRLRDDENNDLGDIDVLTAVPRRRQLWVLECKDFSMSRTPLEFKNELDKVFESSGSGRSLIEKHLRRVEWVKQNTDGVLESLDLDRSRRWRVGSLLITRMEQFGMMLRSSPVSIMSLEELRANGFPSKCV